VEETGKAGSTPISLRPVFPWKKRPGKKERKKEKKEEREKRDGKLDHERTFFHHFLRKRNIFVEGEKTEKGGGGKGKKERSVSKDMKVPVCLTPITAAGKGGKEREKERGGGREKRKEGGKSSIFLYRGREERNTMGGERLGGKGKRSRKDSLWPPSARYEGKGKKENRGRRGEKKNVPFPPPQHPTLSNGRGVSREVGRGFIP